MKHIIINKQQMESHNWIITVKLIPENEMEIKAIQNIELVEATDSERKLVENFLHFNLGLGNYSVVDLISQDKTVFILKVFLN